MEQGITVEPRMLRVASRSTHQGKGISGTEYSPVTNGNTSNIFVVYKEQLTPEVPWLAPAQTWTLTHPLSKLDLNESLSLLNTVDHLISYVSSHSHVPLSSFRVVLLQHEGV